jgi:hypothetical protein
MAGTLSQPGRGAYSSQQHTPLVKIPAEPVHQQAQVHEAVGMKQSTLWHTRTTLTTHQPAPCESWPRSLQAPTRQQRKAEHRLASQPLQGCVKTDRVSAQLPAINSTQRAFAGAAAQGAPVPCCCAWSGCAGAMQCCGLRDHHMHA